MFEVDELPAKAMTKGMLTRHLNKRAGDGWALVEMVAVEKTLIVVWRKG